MKKTRAFFRAFFMSGVILLCIFIIYMGLVLSYEGIRKNGFGEEKQGVEISEGKIRILDFSYSTVKR